MSSTIPCCIIIDDPPVNASYWWRLQQTAFGFKPTDDIWGDLWRNQVGAALASVELFEQYADLLERFDLRGKFTMVPCPAALGRLDQQVRGYSDAQLARILDIVRSRIAPRCDITPEILTHSMAYDPATGAILPHSETAWFSHLARHRRMEDMRAYVQHGYDILRNVGLEPRGITCGGMTDPSGIAAGEMVVHGHNIDAVMETVFTVERDTYGREPEHTFGFVGPVQTPDYLPRVAWTSPSGRHVYAVAKVGQEVLAPLYAGRASDYQPTVDAMVGPEQDSGIFIDTIEAGGALVFNVHIQTLGSNNTHLGLKALTEALDRLTQRYGDRLQWCSIRELCAQVEARG